MKDIKQSSLKKKKALGYLRISDKKQIKGESKHNQKASIEKYADQKGIEVIKWFYDEAKSGKNTERDELQNLLKTALKMKGTIDYVIVYKMNRASRDLDTYITGIRSVLKGKGITVRSATEHFDDSPMGNFMENLHVMVGQLDNENKRETVIDNMARLAKQGYWQHKPIRGYSAVKIKNSDGSPRPSMKMNGEAEKVKKILLRFNEGDMILAELCRYATSNELYGQNGKPMSQEVMTRMLKRPEYAGLVCDKFTDYKPVKGKHPALIDEDIYWQNQEILKRKNKDYLIGLKHHEKNDAAPLSRFIKCSSCHEIMTRSNPGGNYRYYCARKSCRGTGSVTTELAHAEFEQYLANIAPKPGTLKLMKEILKRTSVKELGSLNRDLSELNTKLEALSAERLSAIRKSLKDDSYEDDMKDLIDTIDIEKLETQMQINELEKQQTISESSIEYALNFMADTSKQWSDASLKTKQNIQSLIFPSGFEYDIKSHNFIINEISPLYRGISSIKQADVAKNSVLVIPRRIELLLPG